MSVSGVEKWIQWTCSTFTASSVVLLAAGGFSRGVIVRRGAARGAKLVGCEMFSQDVSPFALAKRNRLAAGASWVAAECLLFFWWLCSTPSNSVGGSVDTIRVSTPLSGLCYTLEHLTIGSMFKRVVVTSFEPDVSFLVTERSAANQSHAE